MHRKALALLASAALLLAAGAAQAATMTVQYGASAILSSPDLGGVPIGFLQGGASVVYQATGGVNSQAFGNIVSGPTTFGGSLAGTISLDRLPQFAVTGAINTLALSGSGLLSAGNLGLLFSGFVDAVAHCTGPICAFVGFPASVPVSITASVGGFASAPATAGGLLLQTIEFVGVPLGSLGGFALTGSLTLTELSRHYAGGENPIPEPGGLALFGAGSLLVALRLRRERSRR